MTIGYGATPKNNTVNLKPGPWAPIHNRRLWKRGPVRLASPAALAAVPNGCPFWIPIFATASLYFNQGGALGAQLSDENTFQLTYDFWWLQTIASSGGYSFQLFSTPPGENTEISNYQKSAVAHFNFSGTAQEPFNLVEPILFPAGTQLQCRVQNLNATPNVLQICMVGIMIPGTPQT